MTTLTAIIGTTLIILGIPALIIAMALWHEWRDRHPERTCFQCGLPSRRGQDISHECQLKFICNWCWDRMDQTGVGIYRAKRIFHDPEKTHH